MSTKMTKRSIRSRIIFVIICSTFQECDFTRTSHAIRVNDLCGLYFTQSQIAEFELIRTRVQCSVQCGQTSECQSFIFNTLNHNCTLYSVEHFSILDGTQSPSSVYYTFGVIGCPTHLNFFMMAPDVCVYLDIYHRYTFNLAETHCDAMKSRVLLLHTTQRRDGFKKMMADLETTEMWPYIATKQVYLGLQKVSTGWVWQNGETMPVDDIEWGTFQPLCSGFVCNCMSLLQTWGWKWNDLDCSEYHLVVCEYMGPMQ